MHLSEEDQRLTDTELIVSTYGKWTKTETSYMDQSPYPLKACSNCRFFSNNEENCSVLEEGINKEGYCRLWVESINPEEDMKETTLNELSQNMVDIEEVHLDPEKEVDVQLLISPIEDVEKIPPPEGILSLSLGLVKVPLAKKGKWKHDLYGDVEFTDKDFNDAVSNLREGILGHPPYLTFGHLDEEHNSTDSHRKRGDIRDISIEDDVLYGLFDQRDEVVAAVNNREYEFASGEFLRNFTDKQTGEKKGTVFMRVALTNSPFLPFSQDEKVQVLSIEGSEATSYVFPSVISLSMTDDIKDITQPQDEGLMTTKDVIEKNEEAKVEEVKTPEVISVVAPQAVASKAETQSLSIDMDSIASLIDRVKTEVAGTYQAQLDAAIGTIQSLKEDLAQVTVDLTSQKEVTQAYSLNMSRAQEEALNSSLLGAGVPASLINSFSTVRKAIETKEATIKLSQNGTDVDVSLIQALSQMLVDAVNTQPVPYSQLGHSQGIARPQDSNTATVSELEKIIAANRELIKNRK